LSDLKRTGIKRSDLFSDFSRFSTPQSIVGHVVYVRVAHKDNGSLSRDQLLLLLLLLTTSRRNSPQVVEVLQHFLLRGDDRGDLLAGDAVQLERQHGRRQYKHTQTTNEQLCRR